MMLMVDFARQFLVTFEVVCWVLAFDCAASAVPQCRQPVCSHSVAAYSRSQALHTNVVTYYTYSAIKKTFLCFARNIR